jgi:integrase/recombinase XerC
MFETAVAPKTLTSDEQEKLLRTTADHKDGFRDHIIISMALGTALREHEILALNVGDVYDAEGRPKSRVQLKVFKRSNKNSAQQEVFLPEKLRYKLAKYYRMLKKEGLASDVAAPLFVSRESNRLSKRMLRHAFKTWQKRAGLDRDHSFHALRHTALTTLYEATHDIRLVQRQARHASITSTTIYAAPSDEAVARAVASMPC